jgi:hypothetical protein
VKDGGTKVVRSIVAGVGFEEVPSSELGLIFPKTA